MHSTATKIFKVLMVCLLVTSSSRGRIHISRADQDYVEDNHHPAKPDEHEVMQDIEKRSPEFNQQDDIPAVKRQSYCVTSSRLLSVSGGIRKFKCMPGCCSTNCMPCGPSSG
ncbi:hypothetical protein OS493_005722 [Desmophyllum pertusum]|uniref:Uncharacterized protein n=1 Tax=Desmophyllum pertusum TaxID=174260 RepID=A0A9W9YGS7_9CNID|nr:hypothetical protein OS493_005722 [Desmophyllum pertusum]